MTTANAAREIKSASCQGLEAWGDYVVTSWWRLSPGLNIIRKHLQLKPGQTDRSNRQAAGTVERFGNRNQDIETAEELWATFKDLHR